MKQLEDNIPEKYDYAGQKVDQYKPYYPELNRYIDEHYNLIGSYEQGESGLQNIPDLICRGLIGSVLVVFSR